MSILLTGGSGFLGTVLTERLLAKGVKVYSLSRHPPEPRENLIPLTGDINEPNLGLPTVPGIDCVYHLAALHRLGPDKDGSIWQTNVTGTVNVIDFCLSQNIPHLYFVSSAYTQGRNTYEQSKALGETLVSKSDIPRVTIFKPSIVLGTPQHFYPGHFAQFIQILIELHRRAELVRRRIEGTLRLPVIEPVFRMTANPEGKLNLVPIDAVVKAIADTKDCGTYWLTHPDPPTIKQLTEWVGNYIMVQIRIVPDFKPMPIEAMFRSLSTAFTPYLWGDSFPSDLKEVMPITEDVVRDTIKLTILT